MASSSRQQFSKITKEQQVVQKLLDENGYEHPSEALSKNSYIDGYKTSSSAYDETHLEQQSVRNQKSIYSTFDQDEIPIEQT